MIVAVALVVAVVAAVRGVWSPCGLSMLSALNPLSERGRGHRFGVTAAWYVAGGVLGGALLGGACALVAAGVGRLPLDPRWTWLLVLAASAVAVVSDSTLTRWALPVHPRQVDERWLGRYRRWIYAGGFGVQIGTGFATYIMSAAVYLTAILAALTGRPAQALLVGVVFGGVRGLAVLLAAPVRTPEALRALMAGIDRHARSSLVAAGCVEAGAGAYAGWTGAGAAAGVAATLVLGGLAVASAGACRGVGHPRRSWSALAGRGRAGARSATVLEHADPAHP